jgi:hypothetical protein
MANSRVKDLTLHGSIDPNNDSFLVEDAATDITKRTTLAAIKTSLGLSGNNSGDQFVFSTIAVAGQANVVADSTTDTLTIVAGTNVTITTNATADSVTFNATVNGINVGAAIASVAEKTVPVDADSFSLTDSADSNNLKRLTWLNAKAAIKVYTDTLYSVVGHKHSVSDLDSIPTQQLVGRHSGTTGAGELVSVGSGLEWNGTNIIRSGLSGDVTAPAGVNITEIAAKAVSYSKIQDISNSSRVLGRKTAGSGSAEELSGSDVLDFVGSTRGSVLYRGVSGWAELVPGNAGFVFTSQGTGSDPVYQALPKGGSTNLWIPVHMWLPRITGGAAQVAQETFTHFQNFRFLLFDAGTVEYAQSVVVMPDNYNLGTIRARFYWSASGPKAGSNDVVWSIHGQFFSDGDAIDQGFGTAVSVVDTVQDVLPDDVMISAETSAMTFGGTPGTNRLVQLQIFRDAANAADTYGHDAKLIGVEILYN